MTIPTLQKLLDSRLLAKEAWVILQHHIKESLAPWPQGFKLLKETRFGETVLTYLRYAP